MRSEGGGAQFIKRRLGITQRFLHFGRNDDSDEIANAEKTTLALVT